MKVWCSNLNALDTRTQTNSYRDGYDNETFQTSKQLCGIEANFHLVQNWIVGYQSEKFKSVLIFCTEAKRFERVQCWSVTNRAFQIDREFSYIWVKIFELVQNFTIS